MKKHVHGGDIYHHKNCLDFSANCNPLGTPAAVKQAVMESLDQMAFYPQVGYQELKQAIACYEQVEEGDVICGNGAAELIFSLCLAGKPKKALLCAPTFAEYAQALHSVGCSIEEYWLDGRWEFQLTEDFLKALDSSYDIVFLCNPNNPTGNLIERELMERILKICEEKEIFLVIDECFQDFIENPQAYTMKHRIKESSNLFLLKAFTKRYAMPGVRLGYGISGNHRLLEQMSMVTQPWNLSVFAQAAGIAALKEEQYVEEGRNLIFREKKYLKEEMKRLGLKVYDSKANYLFFRGPEDLKESCLEQGILIRDCSNYSGLEKGYYRIAVRTHKENLQLISALEKIQLEEG